MDFVKRNLFALISALVGVASLGAMVWGMGRMSAVRESMDQAAALEKNLGAFSRGSAGVKHVTNEYERIKRENDFQEQILTHFTERTRYRPLMDHLLPDPSGSEEENKQLRYDFRPVYQAAMQELVRLLHGGSPPTREEIDHVADFLKKKQMEAELSTTPSSPERPAPTTPAAPSPPGVPAGPGSEKAPELPEPNGPASFQAYSQALAERARSNPETIASIENARRSYCYANVAPGGSFDLLALYGAGTHAPNMDEIWDAHMFYWPQRDVVDVIAAVNDSAAEALQRAGQHPCVLNLPVKDVLSIRVSGYIREDSGKEQASTDADRPPENPNALFTGHVSDNLYDVINVRVKLVIDVRDLPQLLDRFTEQRYATVANVNYKRVPASTKLSGKIYGPDPIVELTLDLQTYMSYRSMVPMMPQIVREKLGTQKQFEELVGSERQAASGGAG